MTSHACDTPEHFSYALECSYCGHVHAPQEFACLEAGTYRLWNPPCEKCGKVNEIKFVSTRRKELKGERPQLPQKEEGQGHG